MALPEMVDLVLPARARRRCRTQSMVAAIASGAVDGKSVPVSNHQPIGVDALVSVSSARVAPSWSAAIAASLSV